MNLEGRICRLRAVEPEDVETMYRWENDPEVWAVSGTTTPFSRHMLVQFVEQQRLDLAQTRQLRLIVETTEGEPVGAIDLFDFDPWNGRAGVGILVHDKRHRGRGYAADALAVLIAYCRSTLGLHQLWCNVGADNTASLRLFRSAGFAEVGIKREWQRTPDGYADELLMQRIL
ncbi:GNAT family N-acetyltransferase [Alistipes sp.]|uniref:GNAT family N-acetyltransferase n=1 Tax=Alistipes sp. TaxID=1872444 RepID=UPI003AB78696